MVVGLRKWLQLAGLRVDNHLTLLFVEEKPYTHDTFKVFFCNLLEVCLRALQMLLALLFQDFNIEAHKAFNSWNIVELQALHVVKQTFHELVQPLVHLRPRLWEVVLDKYCHNKCQLLVAGPAQDHIFRFFHHLEQLLLNVIAQVLWQRAFPLV